MELTTIKERVIKGIPATKEEALVLYNSCPPEELLKASAEVTRHYHTDYFDMCTIINSKSGRCSEDCKWCAQSAHYKTSCETYPLIDSERALEAALHNRSQGVNRFSFVNSGRAPSDREIEQISAMAVKIKQKSDIHLCASLGLATKEQLQRLREAGVSRYHCNLESSPEYFKRLCTTHTYQQKITTIEAAVEAGMDVCSGGIIGMGESMEERLSLAEELHRLDIRSIPINILSPIDGTPLQGTPLIKTQEILVTIALFRLMNPKAFLRLAGGRARLSKEALQKAMECGINSAIVGDLLTTLGSGVEYDKEVISSAGYRTGSDNFDREHLWHPYTGITNPLPAYKVKAAYGCTIELESGERLIEGMSSWWAAIHGYNHPYLNRAIVEQTAKFTHVMFGGLTHQPAIDLGKQLAGITPKGLDKIFFADSGSVATEVAMKMAIQYWYSRGQSSKSNFATFRKGYHGDTWNAMSVCDPVTGMHSLFGNSLPIRHFIDTPSHIKQIEELFEKEGNSLAAFIAEPIVQGAGGMNFYSPAELRELSRLCKKYDILLIADEIATGFGRTGEMFACNHANVIPDIMCIGKGLTGGTMTLSAVITNSTIADSISSAHPFAFMHGPTFMANPLACSVALASIRLLQSYDWKGKIEEINKILERELGALRGHSEVEDIRTLGAIGVVEMKQPVNMARIQREFIGEGVWIRPFGKLIYIMPPYIISKEELLTLTNAIKRVIKRMIPNDEQ